MPPTPDVLHPSPGTPHQPAVVRIPHPHHAPMNSIPPTAPTDPRRPVSPTATGPFEPKPSRFRPAKTPADNEPADWGRRPSLPISIATLLIDPPTALTTARPGFALPGSCHPTHSAPGPPSKPWLRPKPTRHGPDPPAASPPEPIALMAKPPRRPGAHKSVAMRCRGASRWHDPATRPTPMWSTGQGVEVA